MPLEFRTNIWRKLSDFKHRKKKKKKKNYAPGATGSAEELPPRIRADTRGLRPVPRGSAGRPPKIFFGGLRRTFGGHRRTPRGYGRIRAESAANWRKSSLEKCPPTITSLTPRFSAEKLPPRTSFRRGNNNRVRVRVRVRVMVL